SLFKANGPSPFIEYPANEVHVFPRSNREAYWSGNIFGLNNILPAVFACEVRPTSVCGGPPPFPSQLCDPSVTATCSPCSLPFQTGSGTVVFPNAHFWLASVWDTQKGYAPFRACSPDLSTCVAHYEGTIDTNSAPCTSLNVNVDSASPRPYP